MPRPQRGRGNTRTNKTCSSCKRPQSICARAPCPPRFQQVSYNNLVPFPFPPPHYPIPETDFNHPTNNLHLFPQYEPPIIHHPFAAPRPLSFQEFTDMQHHQIYNMETIFQQHRNLLIKLHERSELVGRVHVGVMQTCTIKGIVIDLIVYDHSGRGKIFGEREDRLLYSDIVPDPEYLLNGDHQKEFSRYVVKAAVVPWYNLSNSISSLPLMLRMQTTLQYIPPLSVFKVFCPAIGFDHETMQLSLKMANRSSPVIQLQPYINKELSFAKRIKKINGNHGARPRFLIIIDFEATCDFAPEPLVSVENSEIIEFPWVVLDTYSLDIVYERRFYIKPSFMDGITNYCQNLTGITKDDCSAGLSLADAINEFDQFLRENIFPYGESNFRIVTDSVWDLQVQLRLEAQRKGISLAWWYQEYFDLRQEFRHFYAWFPFVKRGPPLHIMLNAFNLKFVGRHHSGLDDCKTIAQIVKILLQLHPSTFTNPIVIAPDYNPHQDPSWCSFMGVCPPEAWQCSNEQCQVWNKPNMKTCRFCKTTRT